MSSVHLFAASGLAGLYAEILIIQGTELFCYLCSNVFTSKIIWHANPANFEVEGCIFFWLFLSASLWHIALLFQEDKIQYIGSQVSAMDLAELWVVVVEVSPLSLFDGIDCSPSISIDHVLRPRRSLKCPFFSMGKNINIKNF
jgi:hypothetical protein